MKLSHAALRLRTAIAELRWPIGVGSGALLGGMDIDTSDSFLTNLVVVVSLAWHRWPRTLNIAEIQQLFKARSSPRNSAFIKQAGNALCINGTVSRVVRQPLQNLKRNNVWLRKLSGKLCCISSFLSANILRRWCWSDRSFRLNHLLAR